MMLRDIQDENGRRQQSASLQIDGTLLIEGHDLGRGVESFFRLRSMRVRMGIENLVARGGEIEAGSFM